MIFDFLHFNNYGYFIWPSFIVSFLSCLVLYISTKKEFGLFDISARGRLEYRMKSGKDPAFRNRDMVSIKLRRELTSFKLVPYLANEIFFDIENSELNRNRFFVGATIGSVKIVKPVIYFLVQSGFKSGTSSHIGILGFKFLF